MRTRDKDIRRAVLIAPAAVTHATDMNQHMVPLRLEQHKRGVRLTAPPNANVAPPGWYMLFLVDSDGAPSVSRWVRLLG